MKVRSSSLQSIGNSAFKNCQLQKIDLDWKNRPNEKQLNLVDENIGVRNIGREAFADNRLEKVTLPPTISSVSDYAFAANSLKSATVSDNLRIPSSGFVANPGININYVPTNFSKKKIKDPELDRSFKNR